ncbi:MAG TPA: nitroreductase family protein [Holophaga sp.]|nr:nitroreductase family protein [Holophaga sp.]HPS68779.1 nitroreductase family protein [Holophaga sp.]
MNVLEQIAHRESIRNYDPDRPVDRATLERILEAGRLAPSAANRQPWEFLVVQSPEGLEKVRRCYGRAWLSGAPQVLAVAGNKAEAWVRDYDGYCALETDLTIAMDHMILAADHEGVSTCWIANFDPALLREALALTPGQEVFAITPLGYPKPDYVKKSAKQRKALSEIVRYL